VPAGSVISAALQGSGSCLRGSQERAVALKQERCKWRPHMEEVEGAVEEQ